MLEDQIIKYVVYLVVASILTIFIRTAFSTSKKKTITGKPSFVIDGDTIIMKENGQEERVRLLYIDAPERGQMTNNCQHPAGTNATKALKIMINDQEITAFCNGKDRYTRNLGVIKRGKFNLNLEMLREGYARVDRDAPLKYKLAYYKARILRKGLWRCGGFSPPNQYRANKKKMC